MCLDYSNHTTIQVSIKICMRLICELIKHDQVLSIIQKLTVQACTQQHNIYTCAHNGYKYNKDRLKSGCIIWTASSDIYNHF